MKKKILALAIAAIMVVTAVASVSLAYLMDTDEATNVFTVGYIDIELIEQQRNSAGNALEPFADGKILLPLVGSAQGEKVEVDGYSLPTAANWVDKIVDVKNVGNNDAYVRVVLAFPAAMDDKESAAEMMLHWNVDGTENENNWERVDNGAKVTVDGVEYNLYTFTYNPILAVKAKTASPAMTGLYIDSRVNASVTKDDNGKVTAITYSMKNGRGETASATFSADTDGNIVGPQILVSVQAVQADGFETVGAAVALDTAFGAITATNNPYVINYPSNPETTAN